ncbi:MAG: prephenate dehydratase domain-containing protein, partial [Anaerolineales bacterium]
FEEIKTVFSHPVALDQCDRFFERFPHLVKRSAYDTSGSVKRIVEESLRDCAAIAGIQAAEYYGGDVAMKGIQDSKENFTRFVLLGREPEIQEKADKTSIAFSFGNAAGALFKCLSVFALRDIDLTKIESRPIHGRPWEYLFYLDFLGKASEETTLKALDHLRELTEFLEVLGCYPRDTSHEKKGM